MVPCNAYVKIPKDFGGCYMFFMNKGAVMDQQKKTGFDFCLGCGRTALWSCFLFLAIGVGQLCSVDSCFARDYIVEFVEEHYNESPADYNAPPVIYHSIQVLSHAGPKLLILTGSKGPYRNWLRQYIARDKQFIVQIPDAENHRFISSKAYKIEVTDVHPMNRSKWRFTGGDGHNALPLLSDQSYVMVVDDNYQRSQLIASVIRKIGYVPMVAENSDNALSAFRNQPERFSMIIANYDTPGMGTQTFVENVLRMDQKIPIVVETGYKNKAVREKFTARFAGASTVVFKSMALEDLRNTILGLVGNGKNAKEEV